MLAPIGCLLYTSHPLSITLCKVIIDCDNAHTLALKCMKVRHLFLHFLHTLMHLRARVCVLSQSMITLQSVMLSGDVYKRQAYGSEREYIEAANRMGIAELGFSDHVPCPFKDGYVSGIRMTCLLYTSRCV